MEALVSAKIFHCIFSKLKDFSTQFQEVHLPVQDALQIQSSHIAVGEWHRNDDNVFGVSEHFQRNDNQFHDITSNAMQGTSSSGISSIGERLSLQSIAYNSSDTKKRHFGTDTIACSCKPTGIGYIPDRTIQRDEYAIHHKENKHQRRKQKPTKWKRDTFSFQRMSHLSSAISHQIKQPVGKMVRIMSWRMNRKGSKLQYKQFTIISSNLQWSMQGASFEYHEFGSKHID